MGAGTKFSHSSICWVTLLGDQRQGMNLFVRDTQKILFPFFRESKLSHLPSIPFYKTSYIHTLYCTVIEHEFFFCRLNRHFFLGLMFDTLAFVEFLALDLAVQSLTIDFFCIQLAFNSIQFNDGDDEDDDDDNR